jgi:uncharacterized protein
MMKKTLLAFSLPLVLVSQVVMADVTLKMPGNFEILAAQHLEIKKATKTVALPEGDQQVLVRFDSPTNPHSTGQSMGYVSSQPILIRFSADDGEVIELVAPRVDTQQDVKRFAKNPRFELTDTAGKSVSFESEKLVVSGSPLTANYNNILAAQITPNDKQTLPQPTVTTVSSQAISTVDISRLTPAKADQLMKDLYQNADEKRRKEFMRWALGL